MDLKWLVSLRGWAVKRLLPVLLAVALGAGPVGASIVPPPAPAKPGWLTNAPLPKPKQSPAVPVYDLTGATQVWLDGRRCRYAEVPEGATIIRMEVSLDGVILKVHFRSPAK